MILPLILNDGDIIYTSCTGIPFCYHVGIIFRKNGIFTVYNCTPNEKNEFGGNIVEQPFDIFMIDRVFYKTVPTDNCLEYVHQYSYENRFKKWDALRYNCEDYINEITNGEKGSALRDRFKLGLFIGLCLFFSKKKA